MDDCGKKLRVLFVNSGILGHQSVHRLLEQTVGDIPHLETHHIDLSRGLSVTDRVIRRLMCMRPPGVLARGCHNLDLARWRHELHCGLLAARRIRHHERRHGNLDVIHFHPQATAYCSLRRMGTTPGIVSIDCTQDLAGEAVSRLERWTFRPNVVHDGKVFRAAAAIVSTSKWAGDDLARKYPDCAGKINVLPYPVRLEMFEENWIEERYVRTRARAVVPVRCLFLGGDFPRKGGPSLLDAWSQGGLAGSARLDLVTNWPLVEQELPAGVRLVKNIAAYTPAWRQLWREADVFVMPTRSEAFGMVYQEAAAAGLPCIATRINAIPEIVADGETGLLVDPGDIPALIQALRRLVANAELRRRMGAAARRRIQALSSPEKYAANLVSLIRFAACGFAKNAKPQAAGVLR
jgi:starch synthase